jgi:hypothetical protein
MDAHWVHQRAGYRCRHGYRSTTSRPVGAPESIYLREDEILRRFAPGVEYRDGLESVQEAIDSLRSNAMVIEAYGPGRWAVTAAP